MRTQSKAFATFALLMKHLIAQGIETAQTHGDKRFKALMKALEDAIFCIEKGESRFGFKPLCAALAAKEDPGDYSRKTKIIGEIVELIESSISDIHKENEGYESLCMSVMLLFIKKFNNGEETTYTTQLHALVPDDAVVADLVVA